MAWRIVDTDQIQDGTELVLYARDGDFMVRADGLELMTTEAHHSEEGFVTIGFERSIASPKTILIGGLGLGYTLAETLRMAAADAEVTVVELSEKIIEWNQGLLRSLHPQVWDDTRLRLLRGDLVEHINSTGPRYDLALLDIDNGPEALVQPGNETLYGDAGLESLKARLSPNGVAVFWSAISSEPFLERLKVHFAEAEALSYPVPQNPKIIHTFFVARGTG